MTLLEKAILQTLAYSDVFDYPLTLDELRRFLVVSAARHDVERCAATMKNVLLIDGYYLLTGRDEIVDVRKRREAVSRRAFERAILYGRILGAFPFVRMVALTGSLAVRNCDQTGDYDYMLVAKVGRVWVGRAFALLLNRIANLFGETLCPNLIISENVLEWESKDLYSAREIEQMVLIQGEETYSSLRVANSWIKHFLPNITIKSKKVKTNSSLFQKLAEFLLEGLPIDRLETWEMNRKIARLSKQADFGIETNFNKDICQGNFGHHGASTMQKYEERLEQLKAAK